MKEPFDIIAIGLNVVDFLIRLPEEVRLGDKHEVDELAVQGGGPAGNAACVLGCLGWRVGFVGRMGANTLSELARAEFRRCGVSEDLFVDHPGSQPAASVISIDPLSSERTIFYSLKNYHTLSRADVPIAEIRRAKLLLVDGYEPEAALLALETANQAGIRSVLDVEAGEETLLRKLLSLATDSILPISTARRLSAKSEPGEVLKALASQVGGQLIVTDGSKGSWAIFGDQIIHQPIIAAQTLDTTGCGDVYHGGFASAILEGMPLALCMEFASWVAAQASLTLGGRGNLPTREALRRADLSMLSHSLRTKISSTHEKSSSRKALLHP